MTYIPRREITRIIPNKFEAIRVLALECRRLNDEIRAREDSEVEGKLTSLAVSQLLDGRVTYYDAKERREQERSEAMLSAAEGLLDIAEPMMETDYELELQESGELPAGTEAGASADTATEEAGTEQPPVELPQVESPEEGMSPSEVPNEEEPDKATPPPAPEVPESVESVVEEDSDKESSGA
jgi:DNA-directed RNA polymerase subunit K/omega